MKRAAYADLLRQISAVPASPQLAEEAATLRESLIKSSSHSVLDLGFLHWFLVAIFLILPVASWRKMQRRKRRRRMGSVLAVATTFGPVQIVAPSVDWRLLLLP
jgi:hypothetical protein